MEQEIWKDIPNFEGLYQVSNKGRVKSLARYVQHGTKKMFVKERILSPRHGLSGYLTVYPCKEGKYTPLDIHRIVGIVFVDNPNGYCDINHIDGNKHNNNVSNIEWCTRSENIKHAYANGLHGHWHNRVVCLDDGLEFDSYELASKHYGIPSNCIKQNASGFNKSTHGKHFKNIGKIYF